MKKLFIAIAAAALCAVPAHAVNLSSQSARVQVEFAPSAASTAALVAFVGEAKSTICIAIYQFTNTAIADAVLAAMNRGVKVRIIADSSLWTSPKYSQVQRLYAAGADVRYDTKYAIFHNKYTVIDAMHTETGSFNYTASAEQRNAENLIFLRGNSAIAKTYQSNFEALWATSRTTAEMQTLYPQ